MMDPAKSGKDHLDQIKVILSVLGFPRLTLAAQGEWGHEKCHFENVNGFCSALPSAQGRFVLSFNGSFAEK